MATPCGCRAENGEVVFCRLHSAALSLFAACKTFHGMLIRATPKKDGWRPMNFCDGDIALLANAIKEANPLPVPPAPAKE